jgi:hypothetical protein
MPKKRCPICKKKEIAFWESTCDSCWNKLSSEQQANMRVFNDVREACRECGIDPIEERCLW